MVSQNPGIGGYNVVHSPGGGVDLVFQADAPDDQFRIWIDGDGYPRVIFDADSNRFLIGDGQVGPPTDFAGWFESEANEDDEIDVPAEYPVQYILLVDGVDLVIPQPEAGLYLGQPKRLIIDQAADSAGTLTFPATGESAPGFKWANGIPPAMPEGGKRLILDFIWDGAPAIAANWLQVNVQGDLTDDLAAFTALTPVDDEITLPLVPASGTVTILLVDDTDLAVLTPNDGRYEGEPLRIIIKQPDVAPDPGTITWSADFHWIGGAVPTMPAVGERLVLDFVWIEGDDVWLQVGAAAGLSAA